MRAAVEVFVHPCGTSDAPGGGGRIPWRCSESGLQTQIASTRISTSPADGTGMGRVPMRSTPGGPKAEISTAFIEVGKVICLAIGARLCRGRRRRLNPVRR